MQFQNKSNTVQTDLHELLGHESEKLFIKDIEKRTYNWDTENVKNPLTGKLIAKYYTFNEA